MTIFEQIIQHFKTQAALARALDVERMTVSNWKKRGIPLDRAVQIEVLTKRKFKARKIRPDKFEKRSRTDKP
jgi:plasmid maintenance system antidote protein VapI